MTIGPDRIQVLKQESVAGGGDSADVPIVNYPVPINEQEDVLSSCGLYLQDASNLDENVYIERNGQRMRFRDQVVTTPVDLAELADRGIRRSMLLMGG